MAPPTTATTFLGGVNVVPPAIIKGIGTRFGPIVARFAETWLKAFVSGYKHNPLATMVLTTCLYIMVSNSSLVDSIPERIPGLVTSSIAIRQTDAVALDVMKWLMVHIVVPRRPKDLLAGSNMPPFLDGGERNGNSGSGLYFNLNNRKKKQKSLTQGHDVIKFCPCLNSTWFFRGWRLFMIEVPKNAGGAGAHELQLRISTLGLSCQPIMDFLDDCRAWAAASESTVGQIRIHKTTKYSLFSTAVHIPLRPLDTVYLDEKVKQDLLKDIAKFLSPEEEQYYNKKGKPYRRGYLLHGPPGTGKSSLVNALAGHFDLPIYTVELSVIDDDISLERMFQSIKPRSIVLLEDIDTNEVAESRKTPGTSSNGSNITLAGLLNVLDGVASAWGRIVIMTTNHIEKLDDALKRPGRADKHFYIGHATKQSAKDMFLHQLGDDHDNIEPDGQENTKDTADDQNGKSSNNKALEEMAEKFSQSIPEALITPAKLGNYLLPYRNDPAGACRDIAEWVAEQKLQAKNCENIS
ncbi:hypothetical protein PG984_014669 [Apiospora sp. TS-2023a]